MRPTLALVLGLALPCSALAEDARDVAKAFLARGAALFDARDSAGLAATYAEDARVDILIQDQGAGTWKAITKEGRAEIEQFYKDDLFKDPSEPTTSRNEVEFARRVAPDLILVVGTFEPDVTRGKKYPFVQERRLVGDRWLIASLRVYAAE